jgi:hypothetical protein
MRTTKTLTTTQLILETDVPPLTHFRSTLPRDRRMGILYCCEAWTLRRLNTRSAMITSPPSP